MELSVILQLVGSIGLPGGILILFIFLANKHLPKLIDHCYGIRTELALLSKSINQLIQRIDKSP